VSDFNFTHLSTGDLLRSEVEKGSPIGRELEEIMQQGKLVPSKTIVKVLKSAMDERRNSQGFLIDGFPREADQARMFEEEVGQCVKVINFECSDAVMTRRLLQRGQTSGRVDDNEATIKKRLATFRQETLPVIEFYKRKHLVCSINAERSVDEVYQDVHPVFRKLLMPKKHYHNVVFVLGGPGSGKGTHCSRIVSDFNFTHLSTGDLLRSEVEKGSSIGRELEEIMQQGKLVPSQLHPPVHW
jgi:adenylate kinase